MNPDKVQEIIEESAKADAQLRKIKNLIMIFSIVFIILFILAYQFHNWWILLGSLIFILGVFFSIGRYKIAFGIAITLSMLIFWTFQGFNIHQSGTIYFLCIFIGFNSSILLQLFSAREIEMKK